LLGYFTDAGYIVTELAMRDFLHPAVPKSLIPLARLGEAIAERLPLIRLWSGSIWISGHLPRDSN
jgi:hypothetical protein